LREQNLAVQVRTNLTVHFEPGMETMPEFLRDHEVQLVASMPCYLEKNVRAQRGEGVYEKSVESIRRLNALGYGTRPELQLNLAYNPGGPSLPPDQSSIEADYRRELFKEFGIEFTNLHTITNMPIGRFLADLQSKNKERDYLDLLRNSFNPSTVDGLMCRRQVSVGWDGTLYDCDFNLVLGLPVNHGVPAHIARFDAAAVATREIVTGEHCFGCTAGSGSSCGGALVGQG
jgi:radical SAM/Cys-rich protein